jgi:hypothetical protein
MHIMVWILFMDFINVVNEIWQQTIQVTYFIPKPNMYEFKIKTYKRW